MRVRPSALIKALSGKWFIRRYPSGLFRPLVNHFPAAHDMLGIHGIQRDFTFPAEVLHQRASPLKLAAGRGIEGARYISCKTGKYDFIVKVSTRTLVKGYEKIVKKIDDIEEIKTYKWNSVLKDWENI